jgi:hypothetical protein
VASVTSPVKTIDRKAVYSNREQAVSAVLVALFLALAATFSVREHDPPPAVSAAAPPEVFSAGRAVGHLSVIAEKPHPVGSTRHKLVQEYLMKQLSALGVEPQTQSAVAIGKGAPLEVFVVENVLARLKGTAAGKAVVLVAHYDSMPNSFGASDNGSSVASLLETLRALKAGPPLKNDVIFLFTDGEENGLLGAQAFVAEHPWSDDVGVVLNFDARGNDGPVIMFETSENNGWLIEQFAEAAPFPVAHSLSYELYRLLPNTTDLTAFKRAGLPGLNFANVDGINRYHSPQDTLAGVDQSSLQHRGSYVLALTRQLGNRDLSQTRTRNDIYFDLFGKWLVRYSTAWVIPLTLLVAALFAALLIVGFRKQKLTLRGIAWGFGSMAASIVVASLVGWLLWKAAWKVRAGPSPEAIQSRMLFFGFVGLTIATTLAVYAFAQQRARIENLAVGSLLWWFVLLVLTSILLPGASFVFQWPLLFGLAGLGWLIVARDSDKRSSFLNAVVLSLCAVPGIILVAPLIYQIFVGLTLDWVPLVITLVGLLAGLLVPQLRLVAAPLKWGLPGAAAATGIILLIAGILSHTATAEKPSNQIYYTLNADMRTAFWASDLAQPDGRTAQFFNGVQEKGSLADFAYKRTSRQYSLKTAPLAKWAAPEISVLEDKSAGDGRTLRMRVRSAREAGTLSVYIDSNVKVSSASVNDMPIEDGLDQWGVRIEGIPSEGVELQLHLNTSEPLKLRLVEQSYGLPTFDAAATPQSSTDVTKPDLAFLVKTFSI